MRSVTTWRRGGGPMALACLIAWAGARELRAQDDLLAERSAVPLAMGFDFSVRASSEAAFIAELAPMALPDWSRCFIAIRSPDAARPLFIAGQGRRGRLTFAFRREPAVARGGYEVACAGRCVAEFHDYQVSPGVAANGVAGAHWLRERGKWRLTVLRVHSLAARDAGNELHAFLERRDIPMSARRGDRTDPEAFLKAKVDLELRSPSGTALLRDQDAEIRFSVIEAERWGRRHPYWTVSLATSVRADARQLGLDSDGGVLTVDAVLGAVAWVPGKLHQEEIPDLADRTEGVMDMQVE